MNTPNNKRRRESRERIETAFIRLLQERELEKISVTELCREAGVNRTTFYANYLDVRDLADAVEKRLEEEVLGLYREEMEQRYSSHDFLKLFRHIRDNQLFYRTYFKISGGGRFRFVEFDLKRAARIYDMPNLEYHIVFFGSGLNAVIKKWLQEGCRETPEELSEIITEEYARRVPGGLRDKAAEEM